MAWPPRLPRTGIWATMRAELEASSDRRWSEDWANEEHLAITRTCEATVASLEEMVFTHALVSRSRELIAVGRQLRSEDRRYGRTRSGQRRDPALVARIRALAEWMIDPDRDHAPVIASWSRAALEADRMLEGMGSSIERTLRREAIPSLALGTPENVAFETPMPDPDLGSLEGFGDRVEVGDVVHLRSGRGRTLARDVRLNDFDAEARWCNLVDAEGSIRSYDLVRDGRAVRFSRKRIER